VILHGDSLEVLKTLEPDSADSVVTDPPYGLAFMGKKWDYDVPSVELWREVLRVLKPGGHLLSFGGTRTYHRMVVAIEDAGFEIRDQIQWLYGSGFPKSMDISKAIDKAAGAKREVVAANPNARPKSQKDYSLDGKAKNFSIDVQPITAPATPEAKQWQGFGTALKPANEPVVLARKPLSEKTVAKNVLRWGVGGLNIDGTRIATDELANKVYRNKGDNLSWGGTYGKGEVKGNAQGRWPANVILDEDAAAQLDLQSGVSKSIGGVKTNGHSGELRMGRTSGEGANAGGFGDSGGASRFFYVAKASKRERNAGLEGMPLKEAGIKNDSGRGFSESDPHKKILMQNHHPTVKPIKLMTYLCRLITPPGGTVLDPFMGSGTTGVAANREGFKFIGIELDPEYAEIAEKRISGL